MQYYFKSYRDSKFSFFLHYSMQLRTSKKHTLGYNIFSRYTQNNSKPLLTHVQKKAKQQLTHTTPKAYLITNPPQPYTFPHLTYLRKYLIEKTHMQT